MAGITNRAFRRLCREQGAGLYVSEMVTARAFIEDNDKTQRLISFDDDESPCSRSSTRWIRRCSVPRCGGWPTTVWPTTSI